MLFNSFEFLVFFIVVFAFYFFIPQQRRWILLLVGSYLFYMSWNWKCIFLIITTTVTAYLTGLFLGGTSVHWRRKLIITVCVIVNLGLLATFKYLDFLIASVNDVVGLLGGNFDIPFARLVLPVGISFYTFQALSYTFDVYNKRKETEYHLGRFALYVSFFPQLVAGPIERSTHLLPQFYRHTTFEYDRISTGFRLALWGIYKKVCVADLIAPFVKTVYERPESFNGTILLIAGFLFFFQIYCDFSGYSDVAVGVARMLGFDLTINFRQPFFSRSLAEFWRRWHITLMNWFRDYVYFPMGGSRVGIGRWGVNILAVFTLSGLWHGAAWTFVVFGVIQGVWIMLERFSLTLMYRSQRIRTWLTTWVAALFGWAIFWAVIQFSLPLFLAKGMDRAWYIMSHLLQWGPVRYDTIALLGLPHINIPVLFMQLGILNGVDAILRFEPARILALWEKQWVRTVAYLFLIYNIIFFGVFKRIDFIYFQF